MIKQPKNPNIEKLIEMFGENQRELGGGKLVLHRERLQGG